MGFRKKTFTKFVDMYLNRTRGYWVCEIIILYKFFLQQFELLVVEVGVVIGNGRLVVIEVEVGMMMKFEIAWWAKDLIKLQNLRFCGVINNYEHTRFQNGVAKTKMVYMCTFTWVGGRGAVEFWFEFLNNYCYNE